ncbi:hypothetical protein DL762_006724 [Monosporascus cannonballus]|uniref:Uncharacterized protein n=1 Tax=Monosporascus cannonballus TaxID=155416 RepID=A0ABY0H186_9PEZI|nr:hypothetical protein DL762_006724 [Monosporascus cannonballus]
MASKKSPNVGDEPNNSSEDESYDLERKITLQSINQRMTIRSTIISTYAAQWGPVEAFRELVQNWRDGIIKSFKIPEKDFQVICEENNDEIIYKVMEPGSPRRREKECLGYIRWFRQAGVGTVDITNRQATLQPWHLDMGGTSKEKDGNQAGAHGEGLKVALLVLLRRPQNHAIRCRSGSFSWTFNFTNQGRLVTSLVRMTQAATAKVQDQVKAECEKSLLPVASVPNEDVQFLIGGNGKGRDEVGYPLDRSEVTREEFKRWTKAALFLQKIAENGIVPTEEGDLIVDQHFRGNIYLKGLLLQESRVSKSASITGKKLKYGYNFAKGATNRERQSMAGTNQESGAILSIWNEALKNPAASESLVDRLHLMLNGRYPGYADVSNAKIHMPVDMLHRVKEYLLSEKFKGKWFHSVEEKTENPRFEQAVRGIGCQPVELQTPYWNLLSEAGLMHTAQEEEHKRFQAAKTVLVPEEPFSKVVDRLLRASLAACLQTTGMTVEFVKAGAIRLDSCYARSRRILKVHDRWLTKEGALAELGLDTDVTLTDVTSSTVKWLFTDALMQLPLSRFALGNEQHPAWHRRRAMTQGGQRISEYIRFKRDMVVEVKRYATDDTVFAQWNSATGWVPEADIRIEVHRESTCSALKKLLTSKQGEAKRFLALPKEEYFVLMYKSSGPKSFVVLFEGIPVVCPPTPQTNSSNTNTGVETYTSGDRIESLDILVPRDWFQGTNQTGSSAVIGIEKERPQSDRPQKRPRTESISSLGGRARSGLAPPQIGTSPADGRDNSSLRCRYSCHGCLVG